MADTMTTHLSLIKQDPDSRPDYEKDHFNLDKLDDEVWARGKAFNGQAVGADGGFHVRMIPYAENLETSSSQSSDENYIIRTTGGDASLTDGDAWLTLIKGTRKHTGYVPQSIQMTVTPMARPVPAAITATLNEETFIAYVQEAGTYTITYTTDWSTSPATYGITVSNDPVNGDSITVVWDGESDPEMTVNAVERQAPDTISATIDDSVFVAYVTQSGTTTLTYSTSWSADPTLYGITVTGTPIAGDVITVVYVKEVRGTITQSNPETFVSTGWNLYNHALGYARVIVYSETYNFKISGTYTALEFATTTTGTRTTITPVSGAFSVPGDGYLFVTGGNDTDTAIWMTWSDWGNGYNWTGTEQGDFAAYTEDEIDFSSFMSTNFPYGLMQVGTVQDEINLNIGIATSRVVRQTYNATNLANAKASGRQYEYDENYIYIERETPVTYTVEIDGDYMAYDHGLEYFTGTEQDVYAQTLYGANLKNKLERDVLTMSQQSLTTAQKNQVWNNLGIDSLNSKITAYGFSTEYSSVLAMVNDQVTTKGKALPFSFVKAGSASLSDIPPSIGTAEFTGIVTGSGSRLEVSINQYGEDRDFRREIFSGAWRTNDWYSLSSKIDVQQQSKEWSASTTTLADVCAYADALTANVVGKFSVGYLTTSAGFAVTGINGAYFVEIIKHSNSRAELIFTNVETGERLYLGKTDNWSQNLSSGINFVNKSDAINFDTETRFLVYTNTASSTGTKPVSINNGYLFTFIRADTTRLQIFREAATSSNKLYLRTKYTSGWSDWTYITFTS